MMSEFTSLHGQTLFAPPGSEWYHDNDGGVFHSYYSGDTIILGITCRSVTRKAYTYPTTPWKINDLPTLYFYNNSDTVFVYNYFFNRFTPLYVFNVHDGDTLTLPILPNDAEFLIWPFAPPHPDSFFSFIVDSVRLVLYDTATLKTIYTHSIGTGTSFVYKYGYDTLGKYIEKIGCISIGLIPRCSLMAIFWICLCEIKGRFVVMEIPTLQFT